MIGIPGQRLKLNLLTHETAGPRLSLPALLKLLRAEGDNFLPI